MSSLNVWDKGDCSEGAIRTVLWVSVADQREERRRKASEVGEVGEGSWTSGLNPVNFGHLVIF